MKKLLKLLFVLSGTTTLPLSVIACGQEALDNDLNLIYKGETNFDITQLLQNKDMSKTVSTYTLSIEDVNLMAQNIGKFNLDKAGIKTPIVWYNKNLQPEQKCYNFTVTNGEKSKDEKNLTWTVNQVNEKFTFKISYLVGTINSNKDFVAHQKIDMSYNIKCGTSESDKLLQKWIDEFNSKNWNIDNPITINLTKEKIDLPKSGISWSDLNKEIISATNSALANEINQFKTKNIAWIVQNIKKTITDDMKLELALSANLNDSKGTTNHFYIQFK